MSWQEEEAIKPSLISTVKPLPFDELSPVEFERLCLWLVERKGYQRPQHLGEAGSEQGRDIIAYKPSEGSEDLWYFQCKRHKRISAAALKREVDKYNQLSASTPVNRPAGIIFVTSAIVSATARDEVGAYCRVHGYHYEFWARSELDMYVNKYPEIVEQFFAVPRTGSALSENVSGMQFRVMEVRRPPDAIVDLLKGRYIRQMSKLKNLYGIAAIILFICFLLEVLLGGKPWWNDGTVMERLRMPGFLITSMGFGWFSFVCYKRKVRTQREPPLMGSERHHMRSLTLEAGYDRVVEKCIKGLRSSGAKLFEMVRGDHAHATIYGLNEIASFWSKYTPRGSSLDEIVVKVTQEKEGRCLVSVETSMNGKPEESIAFVTKFLEQLTRKD